MLSFNNDPELKKKFLNQIQAHHDADEILKVRYWGNGKSCAIGCAPHSDAPHELIQEKYGIDIHLTHLMDYIFATLPNELAKTWPLRILEAIPVGVVTSNFGILFNSKVLIDPEFGLIATSDKPFIKTIGELLFKVGSGISLSDEELALGNRTAKDAWDVKANWKTTQEKIAVLYSERLLKIVRGDT
jgi:hypothetical protein